MNDPRLSPISPDDALESGVQLDKSSFPTSNPLSLSGVVRWWYRGSVLRLLIGECRSLFDRIECSLEMRAWEHRGYKGSVRHWLHAPLAFESQSCKRAYIRYTQRLQAEHPDLTTLDHLLVGKAWQAGSEWNGPVGTLRTQDELSSAYPEGSNSMPSEAAQQPTKRDPIDPPPSRE
jgi:hypothetical protein